MGGGEDMLSMALAHSSEDVEEDEPICEILPPSPPEEDEAEKSNEADGEGGDLQCLSLGYFGSSRQSQEQTAKVAGLQNLGNTCFLNAVLQCLTYTHSLVKSLNNTPHKIPCLHKGFCAFCALRDHVNKALSLSGGVIEPSNMFDNLCNLSSAFRFEKYIQQDAHEYIQALLEALENSALSSKEDETCSLSQQDGLVQKLFGGQLKNQIKCQNCSHCLEHDEGLLDLCLSIKLESLVESLKFHFSVESIQSECEKCEIGKFAFKRTFINRAPEVLIIQLKRFGTTEDYANKINGYVFYPQFLDLKPFVNTEEDTQGDLKYELYGVIVHSGSSMYFGHYYSFVQTASGVWHELNDAKVRSVDIGAVLRQEAYILFYFQQGTKWFPVAEEDTTKLISMESPRSVLDGANVNNDCDSFTDKDSHRSISDGEKEPNEQSPRTPPDEEKKPEKENVCSLETSRTPKQEEMCERNTNLSPVVDMQCKALSTGSMQKEAAVKQVVSSNSTGNKRIPAGSVSSCKPQDEETSKHSKRKPSEKCVDVPKHLKKMRRQVDDEMLLSASGVRTQRDEEATNISRKTSYENMTNSNVKCSQGTPNSINKVLNHMPGSRRACLMQFVQPNNSFQTPKKETSTPHSRKKRNSEIKGSVGDKRQKQNATEDKISFKARNSEERQENLITLEEYDPFNFEDEMEQMPQYKSRTSDMSSLLSPAHSKKTSSHKANSRISTQQSEEFTINIAKHRSSTKVVMTYTKSRHMNALPSQLF